MTSRRKDMLLWEEAEPQDGDWHKDAVKADRALQHSEWPVLLKSLHL